MKKTNYKLAVCFSLFLAVFAVLVVVDSNKAYAAGEDIRKIVIFEKGFTDKDVQDDLLAKHNVTKIKDLDIVNGVAVVFPSVASERLLKNKKGIERIEDDFEMSILVRKDRDYFIDNMFRSSRKGSAQPVETLPWGIDRVDAELAWTTSFGASSTKVAVIDTGISKDHPDLKENLKGGYNAINPSKDWNDDNGHGSHVAGIIGAVNNMIGVVGVAPQVDLYAVKSLDRSGSGFISDIIEGIQWSVANNIQVINMSFGSASGSQALRDALTSAYDSGIVLVAAAGNSGGVVLYPASYPEVIAISAIDSKDKLASFSSRGKEISLAAPGVDIYSTYKGSGYMTLSGTSMAAPHVSGVIALVLNTPAGAYDTDLDEVWSPSEIRQKLQDTAVDLGQIGFDDLYGWGLVNAYEATR